MASKPTSQKPLKKAKPVGAAGAAPAANRAASKQQAAAARTATATATADADDEDFEEEGPSWFSEFLRDSPSWLTSLIVHMVLLLVLALWMLPGPVKEIYSQLSINPNESETEEELEEIIQEEIEEIEVDMEQVTDIEPQPETENIADVPEFSPAEDLEAAAVQVELSDIGSETAPRNDLLTEIGSVTGSALEGRGAAARSALVSKGGGTPGSEKAVALALKWFAKHQNPDGSWSLDHRKGPCQGRCPNPGEKTSQFGATALALLPFLGAGQTHKQGTYKKSVAAGLYYLASHMKVSAKGGAMNDGGNMYAHGLASIALCEAYAMTQDKGLAGPAQQSVNFIVYAQDPVGGGWRYQPRQAGDTSVVGWQLMALKSAHMAYLNVPGNTVKGASKFLDSVQVDSGSGYGYSTPGSGTATTAVGLLSRMYLGWKNDNPALERGVQRFAKSGPSPTNFYANYYATQVMFQFTNGEGETWKKWNVKMRDQLVNSQSREGHAEGSWHAGKDHSAKAGGRHYCTAMATMILEVYYRHMPIYKDAAVKEDFPE